MALSLYGDPAELERLAAQLRDGAARVRERAADHVRLGQSARWVSSAAAAYRDRLVQDRAAADRAADDLDRAAGLLQAHAADVRERLAEIRRIEQAATAWCERESAALLHTAEHAVDEAGHVVDSLPGPGDKRWLEVGRLLRHQGVL